MTGVDWITCVWIVVAVFQVTRLLWRESFATKDRRKHSQVFMRQSTTPAEWLRHSTAAAPNRVWNLYKFVSWFSFPKFHPHRVYSHAEPYIYLLNTLPRVGPYLKVRK